MATPQWQGMIEIKQTFNKASQYGMAMAEISDQLDRSTAAEAKDRPKSQFDWSIGYVQASDPEGIDDPVEFAKSIAERSEVYLVCRGFRWRTRTKLDMIPDQVMAKFAERASLICNERRRQAGMAAHEDDTAIEVPDEREQAAQRLLEALDSWVQRYGRRNARETEIARMILEILTRPYSRHG